MALIDVRDLERTFVVREERRWPAPRPGTEVRPCAT